MADSQEQKQEPATQADYLWSVAGKKLAYLAGKLALGFVSSAGFMRLAYKYGWNVHPDQVVMAVTSGVALIVHGVHDYLKVKTAKSWL